MSCIDLFPPRASAIDDALTRAMADRLFDRKVDLDDLDAIVRVLMEGRFLAREITPRYGAAAALVRARRVVEGRAVANAA